MGNVKLRRLKESKKLRVVFAVSLSRQALNLIVSALIGERKFGIKPRDSTIRQANKRDFILVGLLGVLGYAVC